MPTPADEVELGAVVGVFGVVGEVRLMLHNRDDSVLSAPRRVTLCLPDGSRREATVSARPGAGRRVIGRVDGVDGPDAARALMGATVRIRRSEMPEPGRGEYYVHDLIGCVVVDTAGATLGTLADVAPGPVDVWVVDTGDGPAWIVAERDRIRTVDVPGRRIVVADDALDRG